MRHAASRGIFAVEPAGGLTSETCSWGNPTTFQEVGRKCGLRYDRRETRRWGKIRIRASFIVGYYVVHIRRKPDSNNFAD